MRFDLNAETQPAGYAARRSGIMSKMKKVKSGVTGVLNQRVRMGLFSVPLWVVGAVYLARRVRDRRRQSQTYA
jgi:hypothetical protein